MKKEFERVITTTEANQNFSKLTKKVDDNGMVYILKNNKPIYVVSKYNDAFSYSEKDYVELVARRILSQHHHAFEVLGQ